jgi:hypothetical protein
VSSSGASVCYRIVDWKKHFENNRTKELKTMTWVPIPNKQDGDGYTELLDHPEGAAHFGAWVALVEVASKCDVRGTLMRDDRSGVRRPHDFASLGRVTRIPTRLLEDAVQRLVSIGWMEALEVPAASPQLSATISQEDAAVPQETAPSRARATEQERTREEKTGEESTQRARARGGEEYDPADTEVADAFDRIFEAHPRKDNPDEARHAFFAELRAGKIRQNGTEPNGVKGSLTISEVEAQHGRWLRSETWRERDGKFACALGKWFAGGSYRVPPPGKEPREIPSGSQADSLWNAAADRVWSARDAGRLSTARAAELFGQLQKAECDGDQGRMAEILAEVPA